MKEYEVLRFFSSYRNDAHDEGKIIEIKERINQYARNGYHVVTSSSSVICEDGTGQFKTMLTVIMEKEI